MIENSYFAVSFVLVILLNKLLRIMHDIVIKDYTLFCHIHLKAQIKVASVSTWVTSHEVHCNPVPLLFGRCFCWVGRWWPVWDHSFAQRPATGVTMSRQGNQGEDSKGHSGHRRSFFDSEARKSSGLHKSKIEAKQRWPKPKDGSWKTFTTIGLHIPTCWRSHHSGSRKSKQRSLYNNC